MVICVAASQNSMHACKPSRPPPGVSDNGTPELPPVTCAVGTAVVFESGAIAPSCDIGAAICGAGAAAGGAGGTAIVPTVLKLTDEAFDFVGGAAGWTACVGALVGDVALAGL